MKQMKAQAALEFLSTYALAFVAISISIGALYYFGIFDFGKYLPQKCLFPSQFKCLDFSLKTNQVRLKLLNNLGENICMKYGAASLIVTSDAYPSISCTCTTICLGQPCTAQPCTSIPQGLCGSNEFQWNSALPIDLVLTCTNGPSIVRQRAELKVSTKYYSPQTAVSPDREHTISGKINAIVS